METLGNLAFGLGVALTWQNIIYCFIGCFLGTLVGVLPGIGALATRSLRPLEIALAALALIALSWAIFIFGLGLTIPVWPEW